MKHSIGLAIWITCIAVFSSCSKKTTENFTPTETYHSPKTTMGSTNKAPLKLSNEPTTREGVFWIGSSMNHDFSIDVGSVSFRGVYAINNKENLETDALGNLQFYPKKSLADLEFLKSEIGNLDYEEGTYYKVEGTKYYLDSKLWAVIVNKVLERVDAQELGRAEEEIVAIGSTPRTTTSRMSSNSAKTTRTTKRWQTSKTKMSQTEPKVMVSSNPPRRLTSTFWISSTKYYPVGGTNETLSDSDGAYAVLNESVLPRNSSGQIDFYSAQNLDNLTFHPAISNLDHEEGFYYKVEGMFAYSASEITNVSVIKVLQKLVDNEYKKNNEEEIVDFNPTKTWHPRNEVVDDSNKKSKTSKSWKTSKKTTTSSTSTNTTKRTKTNERWQDSKTLKDQSRSTSEKKDITPTETWHPEKKMADGSGKKAKTSKTTRTTARWKTSKKTAKIVDSPSIVDGIFWIGSSRNHSFSTEVGAVSVADAYAINFGHVKRKLTGAIIQFYPTQDVEDLEFYSGEIENLDYELGNYYKVGGSLHYEDSKLIKVEVELVFEKVKDIDYTENSEDAVPTINPTETWHPPVMEGSDDGISMVSPNPPSIMEGKFWILTNKNGSYSSGKGGMYRYQDSYLITNKEKLSKNSEGELMVFDGDQSALMFYGGDIDGFDYEEGKLYQVEGSQHYSGKELTGVRVDKVLRKEKKFTTHISWNEDDDMRDYDVTKATHPYQSLKNENEMAVSSNPPKFAQSEEMIIHIGPRRITSTLSNGQQMECLQVQYHEYSRSVDWSALCKQIRGFRPEVGYQYSLKIRRIFNTENAGSKPKTEEEWNAADDYELVSIIRKRWVR